MTIVPVGKINLQVKPTEKRGEYIEQVNAELGRAVKDIVRRSLEELLGEELERLMKRP